MLSEKELFDIGTGFLDTGRYDRAIEYFTTILESNPDNSTAYEFRGIALYKTLRIAEALEDLNRAVAINPASHNAWFNKAEIHAAKKEYAAAEAAFQKANDIYPGSLFYLSGLARMCLALKKPEQAIAYSNEILEGSPVDKYALYYRSSAYADLGRYVEAARDMRKRIDEGSYRASDYNNLGYYYSKAGDLKKAERAFRAALELNPTHPYALDNLGHVFHLQKKYGAALEYINESLAIDPSNSYGYKNRALVYIDQQKMEEARADLVRARALGYKADYGDEVDELLQKYFPGA